ncbi:MAG TPA: RnfABCDGE type electron transport complex subunit D [Saprospiraceae bacterium]|nr:RnfABCDGE type electron transport complex subunit D [Saprospiraceae bacterium]
MQQTTLHISTSPHLSKGVSTVGIMQNVVWALIPVSLFAVYAFGWSALLVLLATTGSAVLTEHMICRWSGKTSTVDDWSAVITGLLLGLTLPPAFPLWMAIIGSVVAIAVGKMAFGGLGKNVFNPALVGRAFLQAAFPVAITTWSPAFAPERLQSLHPSTMAAPFMQPAVDGMSGATPLSAFKFEGINTNTMELAMGQVSGSIGETSALLILLGGLYLIWRGMMDWRIPAGILLSVAILSALFFAIDPVSYPAPGFMLFAGGLMLGAMFMATDMVASPMTNAGIWIYGAFIGTLIFVIRIWGGLPEGIMYAILLGNALSPHLDKLVPRRVYGHLKTKKS